jgi:hypothetical protein
MQPEILGAILAAAPSASHDSRLFFEALTWSAPHGSTKRLAARLRMLPSTLKTRLWRAGLPTPRACLTPLRHVYLAVYLHDLGFAVGAAAKELGFSSSNSLNLHLRGTLNRRASDFRKVSPEEPLATFLNSIIEPYGDRWTRFALSAKRLYPGQQGFRPRSLDAHQRRESGSILRAQSEVSGKIAEDRAAQKRRPHAKPSAPTELQEAPFIV